jgi:hypothetical protein
MVRLTNASALCILDEPCVDLLEPLNDDGTMRADVFYNILNSSYITLALQTAHAADPYAKLYINDYNLEYTGTFTHFALPGVILSFYP